MIKFSIARGPVNRLTSGLLVVGVWQGNVKRSPLLRDLGEASQGLVPAALRDEKFQGKAGEVVVLPGLQHLGFQQLLVVGLGERREMNAGTCRDVGGHAGARARKGAVQKVGFALDPAVDERGELATDEVQALAEGLVLGSYRFQKYLSGKDEQDAFLVQEVRLLHPGRRGAAAALQAMERGVLIAQAQCLARDLVNEPANVVHPTYMVEYARRLAAEKGLQIRVLERDELKALGMGAFLAVSQGTEHPPALVHLSWTPPGDARHHVALVGKCLTFDTGGYDIKPADGMFDMKIDMGGAAAVVGTVAAAADLKLPVRVDAIFAATENMIGPSAYHPGDILTARNGKTIEVINTDAEGRLTLADALCYAAELKPGVLIDLATLTGACMVALGLDYAGLYSDSDKLSRALLACADDTGEKMWRMPMPKEYRELIKGEIADLKNLGPRWGGSITAALFLKEFVPEGLEWAHIDIAGPANAEKKRPSMPKGGTGYPVRALVRYLERLAQG